MDFENSKLFLFLHSYHPKWHTRITPKPVYVITSNSHFFCESVQEKQIEEKCTDETLWAFTQVSSKRNIFSSKFKIQILSNNGLDSFLLEIQITT